MVGTPALTYPDNLEKGIVKFEMCSRSLQGKGGWDKGESKQKKPRGGNKISMVENGAGVLTLLIYLMFSLTFFRPGLLRDTVTIEVSSVSLVRFSPDGISPKGAESIC